MVLDNWFFLFGKCNVFLWRVAFFCLVTAIFSSLALIRSFVYFAPRDLTLPRIKCSLFKGRKELYFNALSSNVSPLIS